MRCPLGKQASVIQQQQKPGHGLDGLDIDRSANVLVKRHGQDAPIHAAMWADELLEAGDLDGYAVWKRIVKAVEELLSKERPAEVTVQ